MHLKRLFSIILLCLTAFMCAFLFSCGKDSNKGSTENVGKKIICKASDFENVKNDWHGKGSLVSDKALSTHTEDLVVGEKYYFVYTFLLDYEGEYMGNSSSIDYNLDFTTKSWGSLHSSSIDTTYADWITITNGNGVTIHGGEVEVGQSLDYGEGFGFSLNIFSLGDMGSGDENSSDVMSYIAVPFTPKESGVMYIDSAVSGFYSRYLPLNDNSPRISANVFSNEEALKSSTNINISNLSYRLISQGDYENGSFENNGASSSIYQLVEGRNYFVIDYDITADSEYYNEIYCGIYVHKGIWSDATLEQANTSKISRTDAGEAEIFDFAYNMPTDGSKRIRTVFSFSAPSMSAIDFELFIYGKDVRVGGDTYESGGFYDSNASKLTFRIDTENFECYVSGYETMTGNVVVPTHYEGYPVVGIDAGAFKGCTELRQINLNLSSVIMENAFEGCSSLENVELGSRIKTIGEKAFLNSGVKKIHIPLSATSIGYQAFKGCSNLQEATFDNNESWYRIERDGKYPCYMMYAPSVVASYLTDEYVDYNLILTSTVKAEGFKSGFVRESAYKSGDYESDIDYSGTVRAAEASTSYYVYELDCTFLTVTDKKLLTVSFKNVGFSNFELVGVENDDFTYTADSYPDLYQYVVRLEYHGELNEKVKLRLIFDGTMKHNNRLEISLHESVVNGTDSFSYTEELSLEYR